MKTFEDFARENDILWNRVRAMMGDPPLPLREYGIEAEFTVRDGAMSDVQRQVDESMALMDRIASALMAGTFRLLEAPAIVSPETGERREPTDEQRAAYREVMLKMLRE